MPRIPDTFRILLIGGGGREHALAWKLRQSPRVERLWVTHPENPGLGALGDPCEAPLDLKHSFRLERFCEKERVNLVVIGPEDPLAAGLADKLAAPGRAIFGPGAEGAKLEADKSWAKQLMRSASIPTAESRTFTDPRKAKSYLETRETSQVVKASGLARGKGVVVADSLDEALEAIDRIMVQRAFGDAGAAVVIEERLQGPEVSVLALTDGRAIYTLEPCQDHKRLLEGDRGPNTGGMGAYCPSGAVDDAMMSRIEQGVIVPAIDALRREGVEYRGVLYAGLMLTPAGPKVLEFNVRFGDPECQPLMMRLRGDLAEILYRAGAGGLADADIDWDPRTACCIVLASRGYPDKPETGETIVGVENAEAMEDVQIFHAGTKRDGEGRLVTAGGRVLNVVALGDTLAEAREKALQACDVIHFPGMQLRRDIGAAAPAIRA
ncbi:MAG: phosphoribosylamine--glycine ligase [Phycisphaeraceae bacterium]|nr:MAG: phosphoribosylamine--glycine ligase [Phycisphaeraceae bacterium]